MPYDEDATITAYVLNHFGHLMSGRERQLRLVLHARKKWDAGRSETARSVLKDLQDRFGGEDADQALEIGGDAFERQVRDRILRDQAAEVFVNRCPECQRIVRTPRAQQCFWCGFDWHWTPEP